MKVFKEILIGKKLALRFYPSDNGWMCGITNEMMNALENLSDEFEFVPVDPTPEMKTAAVNVELFDHDTGNDYTLSWEEVEEIYRAMIDANDGEQS